MAVRVELLRLCRYVSTCLHDAYDMSPKHLALLYRLFQLVSKLPCGPAFIADLDGLMTGDSLGSTVLPSVADTTVPISDFIHNLAYVFPPPFCHMPATWGQSRVVLGPHTPEQATDKKRALLARYIASAVARFFPAALDVLDYSSLDLDTAARTQCSVAELLAAIEVIHSLSMNALWDNDDHIHALHHRLACAVMHSTFAELECPITATAKTIHNDLVTRYGSDQVLRIREELAKRLAPRPLTSAGAVEPFLSTEAVELDFFTSGWFLAVEQSSRTIRAIHIPTDKAEPLLVVESERREPETQKVASLEDAVATFGATSVVTFFSMNTLL